MSNNRTETEATHDVHVTRVLNAPVEEAWRAWTDSDYVKQWWGPAGFTCTLAEMDFRLGGTSLVCMRAPAEFGGGVMYNTWTYTEIVPNERFDYIARFSNEHGEPQDPASLGLPPACQKRYETLTPTRTLGMVRPS